MLVILCAGLGWLLEQGNRPEGGRIQLLYIGDLFVGHKGRPLRKASDVCHERNQQSSFDHLIHHRAAVGGLLSKTSQNNNGAAMAIIIWRLSQAAFSSQGVASLIMHAAEKIVLVLFPVGPATTLTAGVSASAGSQSAHRGDLSC